MRFLKGLAVLSLSFLATCVVPEKTYPLPLVAEEDKRMDLCVEKVSFFRDAEFTDPLEDSSRARLAGEESLAILSEKLEELGFRASKCSRGQIHLRVDIGLKNVLLNFFLVARIRAYSEPGGEEIFRFFAETAVWSNKEAEVRRAGRELAGKIAKGLKEVLALKPQ